MTRLRAIPLALAFAALLSPSSLAGWRIESSDTGPNSLVIWNDFAQWRGNRTTYVNDTGSLTLIVQAQAAGDYEWAFEPRVGDAPNPALGIYSSFRILDADQLLGDLAHAPYRADRLTAFRALEVRNFTIEYRIRNLSWDQYAAAAQASAAYAATENRTLRADEVLGWVTLTQRDSPSRQPQAGAEYEVRPAIHLALVYRIPRQPLEFWTEPHRPAISYKREPESFPLLVAGAEFNLSGPAHARLSVNGALAGHVLEFFLDSEATPLLEVPSNGYNVLASAVWTPDRPPLVVNLPAGTHRLMYRIHPGPDENADGTVELTQLGSQFRLLETFAGSDPPPAIWPWLLSIPVVLAVAWPLSRWTLHRAARLARAYREWVLDHRMDVDSEPPDEPGGVIRL